MFKLRICENFSAAHFLKSYPHECRRMHGHNFKVELFVSGSKLDRAGMVIDFKELKKLLRNELELLDHSLLNEYAAFDEKNPTSENIAEFLYGKISLQLKEKEQGCSVCAVRVWESEKSWVEYFE